MLKEIKSPQIYIPDNVHELISFYSENPNSLIFAGGTSIMIKSAYSESGSIEYIIDCNELEELMRIKRTERYLEIGALVTLSKIASIGTHVIPLSLYKALSQTATPTIRRLATIGGNIYVGASYSGILTVLYAMDSILELRSLQRSTWIPLSELILKSENQKLYIPEGYILTKIRIPSWNWNYEIFRKIARKPSQKQCSLTFCGLARTNKGILTDIRLCFGSLGNRLYRNRGLEVGFLGRKLPVQDKTIEFLLSELDRSLNPSTDRYSQAEYRLATSKKLIRWFLTEINRI